MTSKEIEQTPAVNLSQTAWLRELCIQIARLYEHFTVPAIPIEITPVPVILEKRRPGRPKKAA